MGKVLMKSQKAWFETIQKRVNITSEALDAMKGVKFAGLTEQLTVLLRGLRSSEVESSKPYRRLKVINIVLCNVTCRPGSHSILLIMISESSWYHKSGVVLHSLRTRTTSSRLGRT
jgi:hypothetical protein